MTTPRARIWTNEKFTLALSAAGVPGQQRQQTITNLLTGIGLAHPVGYTVIGTWVSGLIHSDDGETGTGFLQLFWGIGVFTTGVDVGDYPNLELYDGDWFVWGNRQITLPGAINTVVLPEPMSIISAHSRGQRRILDVGQSIYFVVQEDVAEGVDLEMSVTHLMLMP